MDRKVFAHWFINNVNFQFDCESCKKFDSGKNCQHNQKSACRLVKKYINKLMKEDIKTKLDKPKRVYRLYTVNEVFDGGECSSTQTTIKYVDSYEKSKSYFVNHENVFVEEIEVE